MLLIDLLRHDLATQEIVVFLIALLGVAVVVAFDYGNKYGVGRALQAAKQAIDISFETQGHEALKEIGWKVEGLHADMTGRLQQLNATIKTIGNDASLLAFENLKREMARKAMDQKATTILKAEEKRKAAAKKSRKGL